MEGKEVEVAGGYIEITFTQPRPQAKAIARSYLDRYPKMGYDTRVANWHQTTDNKIHFTMRRLSNCD